MRQRLSLLLASAAACAAIGLLPVAANAEGNGQDHHFEQNQAMMHWWMANQGPYAYPNGDPMGEVYPGRSYGIPLPGTTGAGVFAFIPGQRAAWGPGPVGAAVGLGEGIVGGAVDTVGAIGAGVGEGLNAAFTPPGIYATTSRPVRMAPRVHVIHHVPRHAVARVHVIHHVPRHVARAHFGPVPVYNGGPVGAVAGLGAGVVGGAVNAVGAIGGGVGTALFGPPVATFAPEAPAFGSPGVFASIPLARPTAHPPLPCSFHDDCWF